METASKFILMKLIKHPYVTILVGFALFVVMPIAFIVFNERYFIDNGISYIIFWGLSLHVIATACWWKISENFFEATLLSNTLKNKTTEFVWEQSIKSKSFTIAVGSVSASVFGLIGIFICDWLDLSFGWYLSILYACAFVRLFISYYDIQFYKRKISEKETKQQD